MKFKDLREMKKMIQEDDTYWMETTNKETGWIGYGAFIKFMDKIKVFEGNGEGTDDKVYTYEEFIQKYEYRLCQEPVVEE